MSIDRMTTAQGAIQIVADVVREHAIRGMRPFEATSSDSLHVEFKRARAVSCDLSIHFSLGERRELRARRGPVEGHAWIQIPVVQICWSSTGRSVAGATAALALYREVTELAALLESRLAEETIGFREPMRDAAIEEAAR